MTNRAYDLVKECYTSFSVAYERVDRIMYKLNRDEQRLAEEALRHLSWGLAKVNELQGILKPPQEEP